MHLKVIVVSPKYQMNVGYIARTARNFGINELSFVKPRANINGKKAVMFSKHAAGLLRNAKVYKTFDSSISDCDAVIGTTGIWRNGEKINEHEYTLKEALGIASKRYSDNAVMGLVVGRDDTGLNREEVEKCDIIVHIPSNPEYPVLNISHALAVMLYAFTESGFSGYSRSEPELARAEEVKVLMKAFETMTRGKKIRNRQAVRNIFSKMVRRAQLNRNELHALITALK